MPHSVIMGNTGKSGYISCHITAQLSCTRNLTRLTNMFESTIYTPNHVLVSKEKISQMPVSTNMNKRCHWKRQMPQKYVSAKLTYDNFVIVVYAKLLFYNTVSL